MRRNGGYRRDLVKPGRETDPRSKAMPQRACNFVVASVFECQYGLPQDTIVGAPENRASLRRRRGNAAETEPGRAVGGNTAPRTARLGHGDEPTAT